MRLLTSRWNVLACKNSKQTTQYIKIPSEGADPEFLFVLRFKHVCLHPVCVSVSVCVFSGRRRSRTVEGGTQAEGVPDHFLRRDQDLWREDGGEFAAPRRARAPACRIVSACVCVCVLSASVNEASPWEWEALGEIRRPLIETLRTRPWQMREHGCPIVCLSTSGADTGSILFSGIRPFFCCRFCLCASHTTDLCPSPPLCLVPLFVFVNSWFLCRPHRVRWDAILA